MAKPNHNKYFPFHSADMQTVKLDELKNDSVNTAQLKSVITAFSIKDILQKTSIHLMQLYAYSLNILVNDFGLMDISLNNYNYCDQEGVNGRYFILYKNATNQASQISNKDAIETID